MKIKKEAPPIEAKRLKEFRRSVLKMSQTELAAELGKNQATIQRYESGVYVIPGEVVKLLNEKFKMSIKYFYFGEGRKLEGEEKGNVLVKDVKTLANSNDLMEMRLKKAEGHITVLIRELFDLKKKVAELSADRVRV